MNKIRIISICISLVIVGYFMHFTYTGFLDGPMILNYSLLDTFLVSLLFAFIISGLGSIAFDIQLLFAGSIKQLPKLKVLLRGHFAFGVIILIGGLMHLAKPIKNLDALYDSDSYDDPAVRQYVFHDVTLDFITSFVAVSYALWMIYDGISFIRKHKRSQVKNNP